MLSARVVITWAVHEHVLDGLDWLTAWAGELVLCVHREKPLGVFPCVRMYAVTLLTPVRMTQAVAHDIKAPAVLLSSNTRSYGRP